MSISAGWYEQNHIRQRFEGMFDEPVPHRLHLRHLFAATFWIAGMLALSMAAFSDSRLPLVFFVYAIVQAASLVLVKLLLRLVEPNEQPANVGQQSFDQ